MRSTANHERISHFYDINFSLTANRKAYHSTHLSPSSKKRSSQCEFQTLKNSLIRDMVIIGSSSNQPRERLLRIEDLTLAQAIKLGQAAEATKQHVRELSRQPTATCQHTIDSLKVKPQRNPPRTNHENQNYHPSTCKYCGTQHRRGQCPAYGKICAKCSKANHFASVCLSSNCTVHCANTQNEIEQKHLPYSDHFFISTVDEEPAK